MPYRPAKQDDSGVQAPLCLQNSCSWVYHLDHHPMSDPSVILAIASSIYFLDTCLPSDRDISQHWGILGMWRISLKHGLGLTWTHNPMHAVCADARILRFGGVGAEDDAIIQFLGW